MIVRRVFSLFVALAATLGLAGSLSAIDIVWDGGDGLWDDANWNGGNDPLDLIGQLNGSDGWGLPDLEEGEFVNFAIVGATASVTYDADSLQDDFRLKQGSNLSLYDGATWSQITTDDWSENRWTEMDVSGLIIDGSSFIRTGAVTGEGGGALIFGSWRGDDNFGQPNSLDYMETYVSISNGGRLENEGQLWFGGWDDTPAGGTVIIMEINDGTVDLTGGDVPSGESADADLIFANKFVDEVDQPTFAINFKGPGSLIVDKSGIVSTFKDENDEWQNLDPITYEELWDEGLLQAGGKSGKDGVKFSDFFTVTGSLGQDNYTLTYKESLAGDFDGDGQLTLADIDDLTAQSAGMLNPPKYDLNNDALVNSQDINVWVKDLYGSWIGDANLDGEFNSGDLVVVLASGAYEVDVNAEWSAGDFNGDGRSNSGDLVAALSDGGYEKGPVAAVSSVPEPASLTMTLAGLLALGLLRRRHR